MTEFTGRQRNVFLVDDDKIVITVEDNGHGMLKNTTANGRMGLKIMRYRAQMLGGDLILESGANGGASVRCSCPLDGVRMERESAPLTSGPPPH